MLLLLAWWDAVLRQGIRYGMWSGCQSVKFVSFFYALLPTNPASVFIPLFNSFLFTFMSVSALIRSFSPNLSHFIFWSHKLCLLNAYDMRDSFINTFIPSSSSFLSIIIIIIVLIVVIKNYCYHHSLNCVPSAPYPHLSPYLKMTIKIFKGRTQKNRNIEMELLLTIWMSSKIFNFLKNFFTHFLRMWKCTCQQNTISHKIYSFENS